VFLLIPESLELLAASAAEQDALTAESEFANTTTNDTSAATHDDHNHFLLNRHLQEARGELHTDEQGFAWKFGASLLGGFLFPILLHAFFPSPAENCEECQQQEEGDQVTKEEGTPLGAAAAADETSTAPPKRYDSNEEGRGDAVIDVDANKLVVSKGCCDSHDHDHQVSKTGLETSVEPLPRGHTPLDLPLICSILLGDFLHNFTDGIFMGTTFLLCSRDIGYTLVATTIYHEIAQELADFVVLTTHCGLPVWKAILANALSGVSVLLGGLVILSTDLSEGAIGIILSVSAGVYVYITACECVPKIMAEGLSPR
jgi:zinc transporter ZupT